jgi:hypothetical protein
LTTLTTNAPRVQSEAEDDLLKPTVTKLARELWVSRKKRKIPERSGGRLIKAHSDQACEGTVGIQKKKEEPRAQRRATESSHIVKDLGFSITIFHLSAGTTTYLFLIGFWPFQNEIVLLRAKMGVFFICFNSDFIKNLFKAFSL